MSDLETIRESAEDARAAIGQIYPVVNAYGLTSTNRTGVSVTLLYSSLEQARSAMLLLREDPASSTFAAGILLRSQIEHLMRGCFFALCASEAEIDYYLERDEMPKRDGPSGPRKLGPVAMSQLVTDVLYQDENEKQEKLVNVTRVSWNELTAFSHGGKALLHFYAHEDGIYPQEPNSDLVQIISNVVALSQFVVVVIMRLSGDELRESAQPLVVDAYRSAQSFFRKWGAPKDNANKGTE